MFREFLLSVYDQRIRVVQDYDVISIDKKRYRIKTPEEKKLKEIWPSLTTKYI